MKMWNQEEESKYKIQGIMLNLDNTSHGVRAETTEEKIREWVDQFKGTHITDIVMNFAESACMYPSKVFLGWYGDKYTQTVENGHPVDYSGSWLCRGLYEHYKVCGLDYLKMLSKALPEAGINMWLSIRMNDAHSRDKETSILFTDFYHEHPEYRRVLYPSKTGAYYGNLLNYEMPEVRRRYLDLIDESLDRYDVYGFQLEFQRNCFLFSIGGQYDGVEIMNQFMRDAKAIITKYEKKYGHKIKLSVQVCPEISANYEYGLDIMTWANEGLIDMIVPKSRYVTNNELPVRHWKSMFEKYGIEIVPDIEHRIKTSYQKSYDNLHDIETYAGTAAIYFSQGADKIQLYNILPSLNHIFKDEDKIAEYDTTIPIPESSGGSERGWWLIFTTIGSYDKLMTVKRKALQTYNDSAIPWSNSAAAFPATLESKNDFLFRIALGDIPKGAKVTLRLASNVILEDTPPVIYVNSKLCKYIGIADSENKIRTENRLYCYDVPTDAYGKMYAVTEIQVPENVKMTFDYADVCIEPQK